MAEDVPPPHFTDSAPSQPAFTVEYDPNEIPWWDRPGVVNFRRAATGRIAEMASSVSHTMAGMAKVVKEQAKSSSLDAHLRRLRERGAMPPMSGVDAPQPPWVMFSTSERERKEMERAFRKLVFSEATFLDPPPPGVNFEFDIDKDITMCLACVAHDKNVVVARNYLVPNYLSDEEFWRNYFYKIYVLRQVFRTRRDHEQQMSQAKQEKAKARPATAIRSTIPTTVKTSTRAPANVITTAESEESSPMTTPRLLPEPESERERATVASAEVDPVPSVDTTSSGAPQPTVATKNVSLLDDLDQQLTSFETLESEFEKELLGMKSGDTDNE